MASVIDMDLNDLLVVVSVRHSGTHTVKALLKCRDNVHTDDTLWPSQGRNIDLSERIIWCPIRNPKDVWRSWVKRRNPDKKTGWNYTEAQFRVAWERLNWVWMMYRPQIVPVDQMTNGHKLQLNQNEIPTEEFERKLRLFPWTPELDPIYHLPVVARYYNNDRRKAHDTDKRNQDREGDGG